MLYMLENSNTAKLYYKIDDNESQEYELKESCGKIDIEIGKGQIENKEIHVIKMWSTLKEEQLFVSTKW